MSAEKDAAPAPKKATSQIVNVTVYPNSALVTREVDTPAGNGTFELVVSPLPPHTVDSSLYSEGTETSRILSTRYRTQPIREDAREDVRKLEADVRKLHLTGLQLQADVLAAQQNQQMLAKLEDFNAGTPKISDKSALNSDAIIALSKFVMETRAAKAKEIVGLQNEMALNKEQLEFAHRQLRELTAGAAKEERDAVIVVDKTDAAAGKVRLNYLVSSASWLPKYKIRAGKTEKEPLQLEYLAAVVQHTGEDWSGVKLVLSTAQPMLNATPPDLAVLNVTTVAAGSRQMAANPGPQDLQEQVKNLRSQAQKEFNEKKSSAGAGLFNTAAALDQSWELLNPDAAMKRACSFSSKEGPSVTYHLAPRLTVPSRLDEQILEVARLEMAPDYYYKAVPVLTSHVYRQADLLNRSNYVLLPGEVTMYNGADFVGRMNMPLVAIGELFTVGFGVDPQLQVQRQMTDKARTTQGGNQVLRYEYRILVSSYKAEKAKLQVWDRLPHGENDSIGVSLIKATPEICKDALYQREQRPNNLLRWDVAVDPNMSGEKALAINYEFKLELDRQMSLGSFQSAVLQAEAPANPPAILHMSSAQEAKVRANLAKLSAEDRAIAESQVFCAIDQDSPLGSMGVPIKVMAKGKPVFVCCKGCAEEVRTNPDEALAKVQKLMDKMKTAQK
jgi:uncharacterized protein (TIGR02231 family)